MISTRMNNNHIHISGGFMRHTLLKVSASLICTAGLIHAAHADNGVYSSGSTAAPPSTMGSSYQSSAQQISPNAVYGSSQSAPPSTYASSASSEAPPSTTAAPVEHHHKKHNKFSISLNVPGSNSIIEFKSGKHGGVRRKELPFWVAMEYGEELPANAVPGGSQYNPNAMFYVCRANYRGGVHPGKYFSGNCNISWGGREVVMQRFEILVSPQPLAWVNGSNGFTPRHALPGGSEHNRTLYICQANYENGTHTGKVIGKNCNFGWGGREVIMPNYNILVS